ncbi:MAG: pyocin knob domain-containing protein, partial [Flammeovirgaceae bacterium]
MPQAPYSVTANQSGSAYAEDVNATFLATQTNNSGNTAPTDLQALQQWADTATNFMRLRSAGNSNWFNIYPLDKSLSTYIGELMAVFGLGTTAPLKASDNLNSVDQTGFYRITTSTLNNTYGNGSVMVINRGSGFVDQLIISVTNAKLYFRNTANNGSLWSELGGFSDLSGQVNANTST